MEDLKSFRHIFFLGIGGIGMSALARCCMLLGSKVSGYDRQTSTITQGLQNDGAEIIFQDDPSALGVTPDLVIYTPAIPADSKLKVFFETAGVRLVKRSEALEWMTHQTDTIAVAGTHGKTTTSSMISYLLSSAGIKHTAILGGVAANYQSNFHSESMDLMVVEADEYDRSFLRLHPKWVVVTAMDPDHLDIYGRYEDMVDAYRQFMLQVQEGGFLLLHHSLKPLVGQAILEKLKERNVTVATYGIEAGDYASQHLQVARGEWRWDLNGPETNLESLVLNMPGRHNVLNASAACAIALTLGAASEKIKNELPGYKGVSRRFEIRYQDERRVLVDDYAHHPEELKAAITAMRETFGGPVTGVFQPHLFSRTRDFAKEFAEALDLLDVPVLTDIYPAREKPIPGVSSQLILDHMTNPNKKICEGDSWVAWIAEQAPRVLITLGAGDLDKHIPDLIRRLYKQ